MKKQKKFTLFITCLSMCLFLVLSSSLYAADDDSDDDNEEKIEDHYDELEELQKKADKYKNIIELKQKERTIINTQLRNIDYESTKISNDVEKNEQEISLVDGQIESLQDQIETQEHILDKQKNLLSHIIRSQYKKIDNAGVEKLFFIKDAGATLRHSDYTSLTGQKTRALMETTAIMRDDLTKNSASLADKKVEISDLTTQLQKRNNFLESSRTYKETLAVQASTEEKRYEKKLSKVEQEQLDIQHEIESLEISKVSSFSYKDLPSRKSADFGYPVKKKRITQGYGKTSFSSNYKSGMHNGVDFGNGGDTDIIAVADGRIKATGNMGHYGYGHWVVIDHDNGLLTLHGHLSKVKVSRGKKVDKGDKIGTMGTTGFSTGVHLHFTVFVDKTFAIVNSKSVRGVQIPTGATVNPMQYL